MEQRGAGLSQFGGLARPQWMGFRALGGRPAALRGPLLPLRRYHQPADTPPGSSPLPGKTGIVDDGQRHVVLVDDNEADLFFAGMLLKTQGFDHVHEYSSGADAIAAYREGVRCDLIIMDVRMPQIDGFETLEGMAELPRWSREQPRVYMMSAATNSADLQKVADSAFIQDFVRKPLTADKLAKLEGDA